MIKDHICHLICKHQTNFLDHCRISNFTYRKLWDLYVFKFNFVVYLTITNTNPCFRCGKQRVITRTYKKTVDNSVVTYEEAVCPDPECQKALELQLKGERDKREQMALQKASQLLARSKDKNYN